MTANDGSELEPDEPERELEMEDELEWELEPELEFEMEDELEWELEPELEFEMEDELDA